MTNSEVLKTIASLSEPIREAVGAIAVALRDNDPRATRRAFEAALRLQFEARQEALERNGVRHLDAPPGELDEDDEPDTDA